MYYNVYNPYWQPCVYDDELYHHGIIGQKWGVRRYQYEDGSLTPEGKKRYYVNGEDASQGYTKAGEKWQKEDKAERKRYRKYKKAYNKYYKDMEKYGFKDSEHNIRYEYLKKRDEEIRRRNAFIAKAVVTTTAVALAYKFGPTLWKNYGAPFMNTQLNNVKTAAMNKGKEIVRSAMEEAAQSAKAGAATAAQNASNAVKKTATTAANTVRQTANTAGTTVKSTAKKVGRKSLELASGRLFPRSWLR